MNKKQNGFSLILILVLFCVLGLAGFIGWTIYHANQTSNIAGKMDADEEKKSTDTSAASAKRFETIKEWAVKFELPDTLRTINYTMDSSGSAVKLDSDDLSSLAGSKKLCGDNPGYMGFIERSTEEIQNPIGLEVIGKVGNYYYYYGGPQQACIPESAINEDAIPQGKYKSMELQKQSVEEMPKMLRSTLMTAR